MIKAAEHEPKIYGYCRVSTKTQNIERQEKNIKAAYPGAIISQEKFTGTKIEGRKEFEKILKKVNAGDTIVFDSVSRMSRNAEEGITLYMDLYSKGVNLVFLKEPYINTDTYKKALGDKISMTGTDVDCILKGINEYFVILAKNQIKIAFDQAEKEVTDLQQRTKEGLDRAKEKGNIGGRRSGRTPMIRKDGKLSKQYEYADKVKSQIKKYSFTFDGNYNDTVCMKYLEISRGTFYKYKRELLEEEGLI